MIMLIMPSLMVFTIPIALLISILIAMGRFSADNEITALKSSGVSLLQMFYPAATASMIAFVMTIAMSNILAPAGNYQKCDYRPERKNFQYTFSQSAGLC
jgi:lipopolysaccharide export system permease protein